MKNFFLSLLLIFSVYSSIAQEYDQSAVSPGEFWIGLQFAVPLGDLAEVASSPIGIGGNFGGLWNPSKKTNFFQFGADIGIDYMGKDKRDLGDIPIKTTNTLIMTHLMARFRIQTESWLKPYVDLLGGGKFMSTTTKYNNDIFDTLSEMEDETVFADQTNGAWSYGIGFGVSVRKELFGADFRLLYLDGGKLDYISPANFVENSDGTFSYSSTRVNKSAVVLPQVSISVNF